MKTEHALSSYTTGSANPLSSYFPNILLNPEVTAETVSYSISGQSQDLATRTQYSYDPGVQVTFVDAVAQGYNTAYNGTQPVDTPYTVVLGSRTCEVAFDYALGTPTVPLSATSTAYQWQANTSYETANLLALPSVVSVSDGSGETSASPTCTGTLYSKTAYSYDANNGSPQGVRGNLTSTSRSISASAALSVNSTVWNSSGMASKRLDALSNTTTIAYDSTYGLYPQTVTQPTANGVQHIDQFQYDAPSGLLLSHTDQNNQKFSTTFDGMSRPLLVTLPDGGSGQFTYVDSVYTHSAQLTKKINSSQSSTVLASLDGFGREFRHLVADATCSTGQLETDTQHDWAGRTSSVSNPYCMSSDESYGVTKTLYDGLGRTAQVVRPDSSTVTMSYLGNASLTVDSSNGNYPVQNIVTSDGLGRTVSACEVAADSQHKLAGTVSFQSCGPSQSGTVISALGSGVLTRYTYDPLGNLKSVVQPNNPARTFSYDWMSRLLSSTNSETGAITYSYGTPSQLCSGDVTALCSKTDARGITVTNTYNDPLNRLTAKSYSDGGATPSNSYQYDVSSETGAALDIGRMTYESTIQSGATQTKRALVKYDAMGRVKSEWQCVAPSCSGSEFAFAYSYDLAGNLIQWNNGISGANSFTFAAGYDNVSRFSTLATTQNTTSLGTIYSIDQWGPVGIKLAHYTANVSTARNYDVRSRMVKELDSHVIAGGGVPSTATVTVAGQEGSTCTPPGGGTNSNVATAGTSGATANSSGTGGCVNKPDQGTVFVTVDGFTAQTNYLATSTVTSITTSLTSLLNGSSSPVTATSTSGTIQLTTRATGSATGYAITAGGGDIYAQVNSSNMDGGEDSTPGSANALYNFSATYAPNSNIAGVTDSATGTWSFGYDEFNRLLTASATAGAYSGTTIAWSFDVNGNRWSQSATGSGSGQLVQSSYTYSGNSMLNGIYPSSPPGNNNRIDHQNYDAAGNELSGPSGPNQYTYDAEGRLSIANGTTKYIYDAEGRRVAKGSLSGSTFTPTNVFALGLGGDQVTEVNGQGGWLHTNAFANGGMVATYDSKGAHVHFSDWLGTRRVQATLSGSIDLVCSGLPFGDSLSCKGSGSDATEHHFTGKERDTESGLDYFGARYYGSNMGRFMSPDEPFVGQDFSDPQSLNLYSYVQNNPLSNTDPDGRDCVTQTRTSDTTESVSVNSGSCSGNVGDGQSQTYVSGTVTGYQAGADGHSLDIGSTNSDGSTSVTNSSSAPIPNNPGIAFGYNQAGYNQLANASRVVSAVAGAEMSIMAPWAGAAAGCMSGGSRASCAANMALSVLPEIADLKAGATLLKDAAVLGKKGAELLQKAGGAAEATKEFEALSGTEQVLGTTRVKTLADGSKAVLYNSTGGSGAATIAIQHAGGGVAKIRY